jgi:hypothetical protein
MISHTKAFAAFRSLSQAHLNFVVFVCFAAPALRADLALGSPKPSNPPDYFRNATNSKKDLHKYMAAYEEELARSTLITVFSYFEGYVKDALRDIVTFHGGKEKFVTLARNRVTKFMNALDAAMLSEKRKLQDSPAPHKTAKYKKFAELLDRKGFKFPTELLAPFGVRQLLSKLDKNRGFLAWEIPTTLEDCLLFPMTMTDHAQFEEIRTLRNEIAHGRAPVLTLKKSLRFASFLHTLAAKVDHHITESPSH